MRIFRFDPRAGISLNQHNSRNVVLARGVRTTTPAQVGVMHLGADGVLGYHQASVPQLFMVVAGQGWVRGQSARREPIATGQAAFWSQGEWHESGTDTGLTAVVIESDSLDPSQYMQPLES